MQDYTAGELELAVERLVWTRIDREGGPGTHDDALGRIAEGGAAAAGLRTALERARERAERNVTDVVAALRPLA